MTARHTGLRAWLVQRVTAVYMVFFIVFFLIHFALDAPQQYPAWHAFIMSSGMRAATVLFFAALLTHAFAGLHVVITDYVHAIAVRIGLLMLTGLGLAALAAWVVRILWLRHG